MVSTEEEKLARIGARVADALEGIEESGKTEVKERRSEKVETKKRKVIELPDNVLKEFLSDSEIENFKNKNVGIFSITVVGYKKK